MKSWSKLHGVDDELAFAGQFEDDHFEELAIAARTDHQHLRVSVGVHVDDDQGVVDSVQDLYGRNTVSACLSDETPLNNRNTNNLLTSTHNFDRPAPYGLICR